MIVKNRKVVIVFIILSLIGLSFFTSCGTKGEEVVKNSKKKSEDPKNKRNSKDRKKGKKKELKMEDVDKLDIPDRMKKAIKSGKMPLSRVREFLKKKKGDSPLVKLLKIKKKNLNSYLVFNGTVEPERSVKVYTRLSAFLKNIVREEGDLVKSGDTLAVLDDTEIQISYKQAKIQLDQAKLSLDDEEKNYRRSEELKKKELISEQDFQASETVFRKAKLEYNNKKQDYKNLELQLSYTKIKAQNTGYITERLVEKGDKVALNQHVFTIEDFDPLLVKVFVPTSDVIKLRKKMIAEVSSDIIKGSIFSGKIKLINPRIDVQSGTVKVTVEVSDKSMKLKPGMFVEVKIIVGEKENIIVIPRKCLIYKRDKKYVFVFNKGKVSKREVESGISEGGDIEIVSGLKEDEKIIIVGVEALKDGQRVKVVK